MEKVSLISQAGRIVKTIFGIDDISLLKKNIQKQIGKILYHQKYGSKDVIDVMRTMGVDKGSVLCIHASMKEFYNYLGTAEELISDIIQLIGEEGTLIMPAFPVKTLTEQSNYVFNAKEDPTGAGYLAESFRKYPGVKRSINVHSSVCAIGKYADYLIKDHQYTHDSWDKNSPWQRMIELNAIVVNLGMPDYYIGTFDHCVESILQYEHPYWAQFFKKKVECFYYDDEGRIRSYISYTSDIDRRTREKRVTKFFDANMMRSKKLSNLLIKAFYTDRCLPQMLDLGRKGIGIYYVPNPKEYDF